MLLETIIKKKITRDGYLTVADYMALALGHPEHGYYMKKDPFGVKGDFITAPEISQMFGEMIGVWAVQAWERIGYPAKFALVELGPGRGTLMSDLLRATAKVKSPNGKSFHESINIHLVETSPSLKAIQKEKLSSYEITWHDDLKDIPDIPAIFMANEFFDALPIHQFVKTLEAWRERVATIKDEKLIFKELEEEGMHDDLVPRHLNDKVVGSIYECSPASVMVMTEIARRIEKYNGAALVIDYGYIHSGFRDTLQAVKNHNYSSVLEEPGNADITAHVDFSMLEKTAENMGVKQCEITTQKEFLEMMGIGLRAKLLIQSSPTKKNEIESALERLTGHNQMGTLFKVMALYSA